MAYFEILGGGVDSLDVKMNKAREKWGVSFYEIRLGMTASGSSDPDFGARYAIAAEKVIYVPEGRHEWNMNYAEGLGKIDD